MELTFPSRLCEAIRFVETGGHDDPANAVGAAGEIGPLQITHACWADAVEHNPSIGGKYEDCRHLAYSRQVFTAYLDRYAVFGDPAEVLARIWNGGPRGYTDEKTHTYWGLVKKAMELVGDRHKDWGDGGQDNQPF